MVQQKALVGLIGGQLNDVHEVVRVAATVSGIFSLVHVFRNQGVCKDSVLLEIHTRRTSVAWHAAEVQPELARAKLDLVARSFEAWNSSIAQLREEQCKLQLAETALAVAKIGLDDPTVCALADSMVVSVEAKVGEYVSPEKPVVYLRPKTP
ncbi:MAG: hypothetical protein GWQ05_28600 [Verrucomicrobiaceae bacterium]|nr:hypothetical protein [Verrucomicrobiaceae bacterium]